MTQEEKTNLGADAAEVVTAGSIASDQLTHAASTPGPWKVVEPFDDYDEWRVGLDDNDPGVAVVAVVEAPDGDKEQANAHLIAAAPDYHAGMREALTPNDGYNCEYVTVPVKAWRMLIAAHRKAEGRS